MIRRYMPQYNILLRDDKEFPLVRIDLKSDWPRFTKVRRRKDDGATYLGPFSSASSLRSAMQLMYRVFPLIRCSAHEFANARRPCNYYHMKMCLGPCTLPVPREQYVAMVQDAMDAWGRIDILIANAGILRDKSFAKMEAADFQVVVDVHLFGTVKPTKAVWEIMRQQNYGRIIVTTSSTGLYGNFGQTNYGAAKLGLVGFMNSLKLEGQKNNIHVNAICPVAGTRMTENLMPPEILAQIRPEFVTPGVVFLCSEEAPTGVIMTAGGGAFAISRLIETEGAFLGQNARVEDVRDNWAKITDAAGQQAYVTGGEQSQKFFRKMQGG